MVLYQMVNSSSSEPPPRPPLPPMSPRTQSPSNWSVPRPSCLTYFNTALVYGSSALQEYSVVLKTVEKLSEGQRRWDLG